MEPTNKQQDLSAMQEMSANLQKIGEGIKGFWSAMKRGASEKMPPLKMPPLEQKCNQAMLAVKQSEVGVFANKSAGTLKCHVSRGLGELKDVAFEVLDTGLGALGFNTPSKKYETLTTEFKVLNAMHDQYKKGKDEKRPMQGEDNFEKVDEFRRLQTPGDVWLTDASTKAEKSREKLENIHKRLSELKGEIRDAKRELGLARVADEQATFKLEKAEKELQKATDQSKPHTKGKEGAVEDAKDHSMEVTKNSENKKTQLMEKKKEMRQLEEALPEAMSEFSQRLQLLESAINKASEETKIPVKRPLTTGDKVEAKLKEAKGKAEEAKDAALRLAGKVAEPVGTFVLEQYTKVEELVEHLGTKADDLASEQKEKKQLSEFNRRCDAKMRELEAKIHRDPKSDPVVQDLQERVGLIIRQLSPESLSNPEFSALFSEFNDYPSKENFQKLMNVNESIWPGLVFTYGSPEKANATIMQFYDAAEPEAAIARLNNEKAEAETAFFLLQQHREVFRNTDAMYQKNNAFRPEWDDAGNAYISSRDKFNRLMGS